jgi:hypothetical protein
MHISQSKICMMHMFTYYPRFRKCSTLNKITKENIRITMYMYNNGNSVESFWCQLFSYNKNNIIFFRMVARDFIMNFWGKKMLIYTVLEMKIWIYWSESNSWIYFYIVLNTNWKIYWSEQSFIGLWAGGPVLIVRTVYKKTIINTIIWNKMLYS